MPEVLEKTVTAAELMAEAEDLAERAIGASAAEAYERLARGEFEGTIFATRMRAIRFLLGECAP